MPARLPQQLPHPRPSIDRPLRSVAAEGRIKSSMWPRSGWRPRASSLRRPGPGRLPGGGGRGPLHLPVGPGFPAQLPGRFPPFWHQLPRRPAVGAFTATATQAGAPGHHPAAGARSTPCTLVTGFDRPNLYFEVRALKASEKPQPCCGNCSGSVRARAASSTAPPATAVEQVCTDLAARTASPPARYHAGLSRRGAAARTRTTSSMTAVTVMVATNAFGMGIDKSNVSFVIHYNMPKSLESLLPGGGPGGPGRRARRTASCCSPRGM